MDRLPIHSHKAHTNKQDEEAHAFQNKTIKYLCMNAASLLNKMDYLRELSSADNAHLTGTSEI